MSKYYGNEDFNLKNAYEDCKSVFERIIDEDSFQKSDSGLVMFYSNEIMYALESAIADERLANILDEGER